MIKSLHLSAAVAVLAVLAAMPAHAKEKGITLSLGSANCSATSKTDTQAGYVNCLGSFTGNIDNQLSLIYSTMAKNTASGGFGFTANSYYSTTNYKASGNPFAQNEGANDDGVINFNPGHDRFVRSRPETGQRLQPVPVQRRLGGRRHQQHRLRHQRRQSP